MNRYFSIDKKTHAAITKLPGNPKFQPQEIPVLATPEPEEPFQFELPLLDSTVPTGMRAAPAAAVPTIRKKRDTNKLTQEDHDIICQLYKERNDYNMLPDRDRYDTQMLAKRLNEVLGYNKSVSVYSKVWRGVIKKGNLPTRAELIAQETQKCGT